MESSKFVRIMSTTLKKATIDEAAGEWRTHIEPFKGKGLENAYMLVNRETGEYLSITIWQSADAQARNAVSSEQVASRDAMTKKYFEAPPKPSTYEVVGIVK